MQTGKLAAASSIPLRKDGRIIIHFDYDCFYASVIEHENPALKQQCLAIQQKQIIVTCNYEARRRGLYKLQLVSEAKRKCPDVVIVLGEDLTRFRDASKELYQYLRQFSWNDKAERLGFDEVWMDVTDIIEYNLDLLNRNALQTSFFQLAREDPTQGFEFDATVFAGYCYPEAPAMPGNDTTITDGDDTPSLSLRLRLGSHLAKYIRQKLDDEKGYTCTVGISTSKLLSKLVGNLHKPMSQTTLVPPYNSQNGLESNVNTFIDSYDIGKIPGIGFKLAQKLRESVLQRPPEFNTGLVYGGTKEKVTVHDVRCLPNASPDALEKLLSGPGTPHGTGIKIWHLLHGVDDSEVSLARQVPRQISIEDSYIRLDTLPEVLKELSTLSHSLLIRMRTDLLGDDSDDDDNDNENKNVTTEARNEPITTRSNDNSNKKWLAYPRTIRLSTRPRPPPNPDGTRPRTFKRISHSAPIPSLVFNLTTPISVISEKLVHETLIPMFRKLHPIKQNGGWNLSLVNLAVTNMVEVAGEGKGRTNNAGGRDIGRIFRRQEEVRKEFRVIDDDDDVDVDADEDKQAEDGEEDQSASSTGEHEQGREESVSGVCLNTGAADAATIPQEMSESATWKRGQREEECKDISDVGWDEGGGGEVYDDDDDIDNDEDEDEGDQKRRCEICGASVPSFALFAHIRYHNLGD